jgi:hypothetical protein
MHRRPQLPLLSSRFVAMPLLTELPRMRSLLLVPLALVPPPPLGMFRANRAKT